MIDLYDLQIMFVLTMGTMLYLKSLIWLWKKTESPFVWPIGLLMFFFTCFVAVALIDIVTTSL